MTQAIRALAYAFESGALAPERAFFLRAEPLPFKEIDAEQSFRPEYLRLKRTAWSVAPRIDSGARGAAAFVRSTGANVPVRGSRVTVASSPLAQKWLVRPLPIERTRISVVDLSIQYQFPNRSAAAPRRSSIDGA